MREKLFHRDFTLVVIGQIISLLGNAVLRFVLPLYLLDVTGSRSLFGLCSAAAFVPMVVLTPLRPGPGAGSDQFVSYAPPFHTFGWYVFM